MLDKPRVSVVMPIYNAEAFVEASMRSVLNSDLRELELIAVDDGSKDRSGAIVTSINDARVHSITLPPSGGPSRPRNVGIARAQAPYVAFLDSDDLIAQDALSASAQALDAHPEAGLCFTDYQSIDAAGALLQPSVHADYPGLRSLKSTPAGAYWRFISQPDFSRGLLYENFISTSGLVVRRELLAQVGPFDEALAYSEDRDMWFRLAHRCGALYGNHIGLSRRLRAGSLSFGSQSRNARHRITVLRRERGRWNEHEARRQIDRRIAENFAAIGYEERRRDRLHAASLFARAFITSPQVRWVRGLLGSLIP